MGQVWEMDDRRRNAVSRYRIADLRPGVAMCDVLMHPVPRLIGARLPLGTHLFRSKHYRLISDVPS